MGHAKHDDRAYPLSEPEMLRAPSLTSAVKAKDRRIAALEDLVRDLVEIGPSRTEGRGCEWCTGNYVRDDRTYRPHDVDCAYQRARPLKRVR